MMDGCVCECLCRFFQMIHMICESRVDINIHSECGSKCKTENTLTHVVCNGYLLLMGMHNCQPVLYECKVCFQGRKDQHTHSQVLAYQIQSTAFSTSSVFFYKQ